MNKYDELQDEIKRLTKDIEHYQDRCKALEALVDSQYETIKTMHMVFILNQAEIKKLKETQ